MSARPSPKQLYIVIHDRCGERIDEVADVSRPLPLGLTCPTCWQMIEGTDGITVRRKPKRDAPR